MRILKELSSDEAVDGTFDAAWREHRRGCKAGIEVHLFLKSLGHNSINIDSQGQVKEVNQLGE